MQSIISSKNKYVFCILFIFNYFCISFAFADTASPQVGDIIDVEWTSLYACPATYYMKPHVLISRLRKKITCKIENVRVNNGRCGARSGIGAAFSPHLPILIFYPGNIVSFFYLEPSDGDFYHYISFNITPIDGEPTWKAPPEKLKNFGDQICIH